MTTHSKPILVGVDHSHTSDAAVRWAADEALRRGTALELVHAGYFLYGPVSVPDETVETDLLSELKRTLDATAALVHRVAPAVEVRPRVHDGDPIDYLVDQSAAAELIVLGTQPMGAVRGAVMRSISQSVAAHAHCPVVAITDHPDVNAQPTGSIVVGVSPSPGGHAALEFAFREAQLRACSVTAVRSWADADLQASVIGLESSYLAECKRIEGDLLKEALQPYLARYPGVVVAERLADDRAQWSLQHAALGAEMLVVGAHREDSHWFSRLGPVASWLLHRSPCPIAIVGRDRQPG